MFVPRIPARAWSFCPGAALFALGSGQFPGQPLAESLGRSLGRSIAAAIEHSLHPRSPNVSGGENLGSGIYDWVGVIGLEPGEARAHVVGLEGVLVEREVGEPPVLLCCHSERRQPSAWLAQHAVAGVRDRIVEGPALVAPGRAITFRFERPHTLLGRTAAFDPHHFERTLRTIARRPLARVLRYGFESGQAARRVA